MPLAVCPVCNASFHLLVRGDPGAWESAHVQERNAEGTPLLKCFRCWVELRPGHRVTVRVLPEAQGLGLVLGQEGIVESPGALEGRIVVRFGATLAEFSREHLYCVPGQSPVA